MDINVNNCQWSPFLSHYINKIYVAINQLHIFANERNTINNLIKYVMKLFCQETLYISQRTLTDCSNKLNICFLAPASEVV
jgi:hypothetical protein